MAKTKVSHTELWSDLFAAGIWVGKRGKLFPVVDMDDNHLINVAGIVVRRAYDQHAFRRMATDGDKSLIDFIHQNPIWVHVEAEMKKRGLESELRKLNVYRTTGLPVDE